MQPYISMSHAVLYVVLLKLMVSSGLTSVRYHAKRNFACSHVVCVLVLVVCVSARIVVQPVVSTVDIIVVFCMSVPALLFTSAA